jgi:heme/copper-type cytochrome/quinol oxidase subunit 2
VMHGYMAGRVIVKAPDEYAAWMKGEETRLAAASAPEKAASAPKTKVAKSAAKKT